MRFLLVNYMPYAGAFVNYNIRDDGEILTSYSFSAIRKQCHAKPA
jgi:hypothetical protein